MSKTGVACHRVAPSTKTAVPAHLRNTAPDIFAGLAEHIRGCGLVAQDGRRVAQQLSAVALDGKGRGKLMGAGLCVRANALLDLGSDVMGAAYCGHSPMIS